PEQGEGFAGAQGVDGGICRALLVILLAVPALHGVRSPADDLQCGLRTAPGRRQRDEPEHLTGGIACADARALGPQAQAWLEMPEDLRLCMAETQQMIRHEPKLAPL